jgi:hypothetical protein
MGVENTKITAMLKLDFILESSISLKPIVSVPGIDDGEGSEIEHCLSLCQSSDFDRTADAG